jgi:hypothetical protein
MPDITGLYQCDTMRYSALLHFRSASPDLTVTLHCQTLLCHRRTIPNLASLMLYAAKQRRAFTTDHNTTALRSITKHRPCTTTLNDTNTRQRETIDYLAIPMHYHSIPNITFAILDQAQQNHNEAKRDITKASQSTTELCHSFSVPYFAVTLTVPNQTLHYKTFQHRC